MKRLTLVRLLIPLCLSLLLPPSFAQESGAPVVPVPVPAAVPKAKAIVAVYIAGQETKESQGMHTVLGAELVGTISASDNYSAVDRTVQALALLEREQAYQRSGAVGDEYIVALGRQFAAQYLCVAEVTPVRGGKYYLNARLVDVGTAVTVASATEYSTLEDIGEMRRVARLAAYTLIGDKGKVAELAAGSAPAAYQSAPDPITARTRREEAERAEREQAERERASLGGYSSRYTGEKDESAAEEESGYPTRPRDSESNNIINNEISRDKIRYGGRAAFSFISDNALFGNSGGDGIRSRSAGTFFSLGFTMGIPIANTLSLVPEFGLDVRSMDLDVWLPQDGGGHKSYSNDAVTEYGLYFPLVIRCELYGFYAEAGLRFDYPLVSDLGFAGTGRARVDVGGVLGVGYAFGSPSASARYLLGYRFECDFTKYDDKGYFKFDRHSLGFTLLI